MEDRARSWSLAGSLVAALAASACCVGPLVVAALGVGGAAGAFAVFGAYRAYLLAATAVLLGVGFYLTYRPRRATRTTLAGGIEADGCGCEAGASHGRGRIGLWVATAMVVLFAVIPPVLARIADGSAAPPGSAAGSDRVRSAAIGVVGIDCAACAAPIRAALSRVGGFHDLILDIPKQTVTVIYEPAAGRLEAYVAAIDELGYEASLPTGPSTDEPR